MAAVKIVCLIGPPAYLNYFVNEISSHFEVALIIREHTPANKLLEKIQKKGLVNSFRIAFQKLKTRTRYQKEYNEILKDKWLNLPVNVPLFQTPSINESQVSQKLRNIKPDVVLVHGTSLIKMETLKDIPLVLNLHWGLSPYYKGSFCTEWALINNDPFNIGFTIHRVSAKIDGGDILTQGTVTVEANDTSNRINMKLTKSGTSEMIKAIHRIINKEVPQYKIQEQTSGLLYLTKHWNRHCQKLINYLETSGSISEMIKKPSRKALSIVKW